MATPVSTTPVTPVSPTAGLDMIAIAASAKEEAKAAKASGGSSAFLSDERDALYIHLLVQGNPKKRSIGGKVPLSFIRHQALLTLESKVGKGKVTCLMYRQVCHALEPKNPSIGTKDLNWGVQHEFFELLPTPKTD